MVKNEILFLYKAIKPLSSIIIIIYKSKQCYIQDEPPSPVWSSAGSVVKEEQNHE